MSRHTPIAAMIAAASAVGSLLTGVAPATTVDADDAPFVIVHDQITTSTDDINIAPRDTQRIVVDNYQGFPIDVDLGLRIEHSAAAHLVIELETNDDDPHVVAQNMTGMHLGTGDDCDGTPTVFDSDATHGYLDVGAPRSGRVRPEEGMDEFLYRDAAEGFEVVVHDTTFPVGGTIDCYEINVTSVVPQGDGTYYVTDTLDDIDFTNDRLTLREAMLLADNDGQASTVILGTDRRYTLECVDTGVLMTSSDEGLTVVGNGSQISNDCPDQGLILAEGPVAVQNTRLGPSSGIAVDARSVTLTDSSVRANQSGILSGGAVEVIRSEISGNGTAPSAHANVGGIAGGRVSIVDSSIDSNFGITSGGVLASRELILTNSILERNGAVLQASAANTESLHAVNTVITGKGGGSAFRPMIAARETVELVDTTVWNDNAYALQAETLIAQRSAIFSADAAETCAVASIGSDEADINVVGSATCAGPADVVANDPLFQPTGLPRPLPNSPLIDAIPAGRCAGTTDYLGTQRPQGNGCDAGALEAPPAATPTDPGGAPPDPSAPAGFEALEPARLLDTRSGGVTIDGQHSGSGVVPAGTTIEVSTAGRGGVHPDATAAFLNVTAVNPEARGFITVYPCGTPRPTASNLNYQPGVTTPNAVLTRIGTNGNTCIHTHATTHLVIDTNGHVHGDTPDPSLEPARLLDTRSGGVTIDGQHSGSGVVPAGTTIEVSTAGRGGVHPDATAAFLNVTAVNPEARGFITVYPCGTPRPTASNLNYQPGVTTPNAVLTRIGTNGNTCIHTHATTHLVIDTNGHIHGNTADPSLEPARLLDTRAGEVTIDAQHAGTGIVPAGTTIEVVTTGRGGIDPDATGGFLNVTAVNPQARGFITVYPCGTPRPTASNLNYQPGVTTPNAVLTQIGANGTVCVYTHATTHLVIDTNGHLGSEQ